MDSSTTAIIETPFDKNRQTYTNEIPASYAVFNSIINNVAVGDERNFVRIREVGSSALYADEVEVIPGREYEVYIYFHNNAASNMNQSGYGLATNTRIASAYPVKLHTGERGKVSGIISWSYTKQNDKNLYAGTVWDEAYVTAKDNNVVLKYKPGTAVIHNAGEIDGFVLSSELFTKTGTLIGFNKLEGVVPGCAEYSGYITYSLTAEKAK